MSKPQKNTASLKSKLLKGGMWAFIGKFITGGGTIVIAALLARMLPPDDLGSYILALSLCYVIGISACLGQDQVAIKTIAETLSQNALAGTSTIVYRLFTIAFSGALLMVVVFWFGLGEWLLGTCFRADALLQTIGLMCLWFFAQAIQKMVGDTFRGYHDIKSASYFSGGLLGGSLCVTLHIAVLTALLIADKDLTAADAISLSVIVTSFCALLGLAMLAKTIMGVQANTNDSTSFRELLDVGTPLWVTGIASMSMGHVDIWIVAAFLPAETVALYFAVTRLVKFLSTAPLVINDVIMPIISQLYAQKRIEQLQWVLSVTAGIGTMLSLPLCMVFTLFGAQTLGFLYGTFYESGALVLAILTLAQFIYVWSGSGGDTLAMTGYGKQQLVVSIVVVAIAIAGAILMVEPLGLTGVVCAFALSILVQQIAELLIVRRLCGIWIFASYKFSSEAISDLLSMIKRANSSKYVSRQPSLDQLGR